MLIETAADALVSAVNDAVERAQEGTGRLYAANISVLDERSTAVLEAINLDEPAFGETKDEVDDLDSPAARLDMVRAALRGILDNPSSAVPLAKAGLDFCDLTQAQRQAMRGDSDG